MHGDNDCGKEMEIPTYQEIKEVNDQAEKLENELNMLFMDERDSQKAVELLLETKTAEIASKNQRIFILLILAHIVKLEIEQDEKNTLFENRTTDDLIRLYQIMVLLFRRIEFDLPVEYLGDVTDFILSEKISATAVFGIITSARIIVQKDKVRNGIMKLLGGLTV